MAELLNCPRCKQLVRWADKVPQGPSQDFVWVCRWCEEELIQAELTAEMMEE